MAKNKIKSITCRSQAKSLGQTKRSIEMSECQFYRTKLTALVKYMCVHLKERRGKLQDWRETKAKVNIVHKSKARWQGGQVSIPIVFTEKLNDQMQDVVSELTDITNGVTDKVVCRERFATKIV